MIAVAERIGKNKKLLVMENAEKTVMAEIAKVSSVINLGHKHSWAISNTDIDATRDLRLIGIKKYWRRAG